MINFNRNFKYVTEIKRKKTDWTSVVWDGAERYLGWKSAINDFTSQHCSFHILCSTPFVHPVLKQVLPKAEIRRIRVWRKFKTKGSSSHWEEWELPATEREKAAESRLKKRSTGTVVPLRCNKGFKGAKHLEERKQKNWPHVNFNFVQKFHSGSKSYSESLVGNSIFLRRSSASASGKLFPSSWKTSFVKVLACSSLSPKESFEEKTSASHVWTVIWAVRARHRGNL